VKPRRQRQRREVLLAEVAELRATRDSELRRARHLAVQRSAMFDADMYAAFIRSWEVIDGEYDSLIDQERHIVRVRRIMLTVAAGNVVVLVVNVFGWFV
jgi:hypothetical protein